MARSLVFGAPQDAEKHLHLLQNAAAAPADSRGEYFLPALQQLFYRMQFQVDSEVSPKQLLYTLGFREKDFQQRGDANEIVKLILNAFDFALRSKNETRASLAFFQAFEVNMHHAVQCTNCNYISNSQQIYSDIILPVC